ncbi:MAG TPA: hypothetical protein VK875_01645 [Euzebyales bacterium]|nr:hypothetical protein [Euzebyales bacterium]
MWALLSLRFRRWLLLVVGAPLAARLLHRVADGVESRYGRSGVSNGLRTVADLVPGRRRRRAGRRR